MNLLNRSTIDVALNPQFNYLKTEGNRERSNSTDLLENDIELLKEYTRGTLVGGLMREKTVQAFK